MKLTTLKKTRVIFCLTCIYGVNHGWAVDEHDKVTGDNGTDSPRNNSRTNSPDDGFLRITDAEAELYTQQGTANVVTASPIQQKQNHWLWRNTVEFVWPTAKPASNVFPVASELDSLKQSPVEDQNLVVDALVKTEDLLSRQTLDQSSAEEDAEASENEDEEESVNTARNQSRDASEDGDDVQDDSGSEEDSANDTSMQGELREKEAALTRVDSTSPIQTIVQQGVPTKDDDEESSVLNKDSANDTSMHEELREEASELPQLSTASVNAQGLTSEPVTLASGGKGANADIPQDFHSFPIEFSIPNVIDGQEGEGKPFFTQATWVALGLSAVIILPHLLSRLAKK